MAHPVLWYRKPFFYPIGNTAAVNLAQDLTPEDPANFLLLGCGDPRHILYTIYSASASFPRRHDFTCCDLEPAILARNVVVLTLVADGESAAEAWNIFFHFRLEKSSLSLLESHCQKLIEASKTSNAWAESKYGSYLKICDVRTLSELRRHWILYSEMKNLPHECIKDLRKDFYPGSKSIRKNYPLNISGARSAGPAWLYAMEVSPKMFQNYWKSGTTFTGHETLLNATNINPMFVYSAAGERFNVHYGTDPLLPFHTAPAFSTGKIKTIPEAVAAVRTQFYSWCDTFKASVSPPSDNTTIIRLFVGDALEFCQALRHCAIHNVKETPAYVSHWNPSPITFNQSYLNGASPTKFNVIETSNLTDDIGLLNLLIATIPLLSQNPSATLYTEALLASGEDPTVGFKTRLCADIGSLSVLLGLAPVQYMSRFSTHSNTHEIMCHRSVADEAQFHERTTWKTPVGDTVAAQILDQGILLNPHQFGTWLFGVYLKMFANEDTNSMMQVHSPRALSERSMVYYTRETPVLLMKLLKEKVKVDWDGVMDRFFDLLNADRTLIVGFNNYQDLCCQLHLHGVYSVSKFKQPLQPVSRFKHWKTIPPIVRAVLIIPRNSPKLRKLEEMNPETFGAPVLHCETRTAIKQNIFSSIRVALGTVKSSGELGEPKILFTEDPEGWSGTSPLVVSFLLPSWILTLDPDDITIGLHVRTTPASVMRLMGTLGTDMHVFSAKLMDEELVHIVPYSPNQYLQNPKESARVFQLKTRALGSTTPAEANFDQECHAIDTLTVRVNIDEAKAKSELSGGAAVKTEQISPCAMKLMLGRELRQEIAFPFPVTGSASKLRIARKSSYIEIVVPISGAFLPDGYSLNPFPVVIQNKDMYTWNIHRVNLERLPILDTSEPEALQWLNTHLSVAWSDREIEIRNKKTHTDVFTDIKDSIHTVFLRSIGLGSRKARVFAFADQTNNVETIWFINEMRFDLSSHTLVVDGWILSLTTKISHEVRIPLERLHNSGTMSLNRTFGNEQQAWKQLLPALAERCRTWKHTERCEYLIQGLVPLSVEDGTSPICDCGRGKDVDAFRKVKEWEGFAPYVTRVALGPLFAVSYLERIAGAVERILTPRMDRPPGTPDVTTGSASVGTGGNGKCKGCGGAGKPKIMMCAGCRKVGYCSQTCQKGDWKMHKAQCKKP